MSILFLGNVRGNIEESRSTGIPGRIKNAINRFLFMAYKKYT